MNHGIDYAGISTPFFCHDGKGNLLMHKRSRACRDEQGTWDCGSGKLEEGLTPQENVLKEIMEEYGCHGTIQEEFPSYDLMRESNGVTSCWMIIPFFVLVNPNEVKNNEPEKIDEIGWFKLDNLPAPLHSGFEKELKLFPEYFNKYLQTE
jgi:8-oxo-dGTP diphosphatase